MPTLRKGQLIRNPRTGETGAYIAAWQNQSGQLIVNVRLVGSNRAASWNVLSLAVSHA